MNIALVSVISRLEVEDLCQGLYDKDHNGAAVTIRLNKQNRKYRLVNFNSFQHTAFICYT